MISSSDLITLGLPCYNERENIAAVMAACVAELDKLGRPWELIVVDNKSSDGTPEVVREYIGQKENIRLIVHPENRFYSGSCATVVREARGAYIAIMDSDGQFSAVDLPNMLAKLEGGANFVIGWRKDRHDPVSRLLMSKVFNGLGRFHLGFPFHDLNCGIRMFDRRFAAVAEIKHRINMVNPEFYVRAVNAGLKIEEVVITHAERTKGQTSHDFGKSLQLLKKVNEYFSALGAEKKKS